MFLSEQAHEEAPILGLLMSQFMTDKSASHPTRGP